MEQKHVPLSCPFCGGYPKIEQSTVHYCQLHGEPSQAMIVLCKNNSCRARPKVSAGDCYNHTKAEGFNAGKQRAIEEAIAIWNIRNGGEII